MLYTPHREEFHIEEVIGFNRISIEYFLIMDELEQAEIRLKIMQDIDKDHPKTLDAEELIQSWDFIHPYEEMEEEEEFRKKMVVKTNRSHLQTTKAPEFHFPKQIGWLYENDLSISHDKIQQILQLEKDKLREDLEKMLQDSINRFDHFSKEIITYGYENEKLDFPMHALLLLSELKSEKSLPVILQLLKQDTDFNSLWFGDFINDVMETAIYHCGKYQSDKLYDFLKLPNIYNINKAVAGEALVNIIADSTEDRAVFVKQYREVLNVYIENADDEDYVDTEAIGFLISDILDLGYQELLPEIKQLFDLEIVGYWICGDYDEVESEITKEPLEQDLKFIKKGIFEKYEELSKQEEDISVSQDEDNYFPDDFSYNDEEISDVYHSSFLNEPIQKPKKIGRNDPCPCGSGKKYKKCCIDND